MRTFNRSLIASIALLILGMGSNAIAQTCPGGKVEVIMLNGILTTPGDWRTSVRAISDNFVSDKHHPELKDCVTFVPIYNQTNGILADLLQSKDQAIFQNAVSSPIQLFRNNTAEALSALASPIRPVMSQGAQAVYDTLVLLNNEILSSWATGTRVIVVTHSQGNFFGNEIYNFRMKDPDAKTAAMLKYFTNPTVMMAQVGIATPTSTIADGRNKYVTDCFDGIYRIPPTVGIPTLNSLYCTVNKSDHDSAAAILDYQTDMYLGFYLYHMIDHYMLDGVSTQKQFYAYLEDTLQDPACGSDSNCYLKDIYTNSATTSYTDNWSVTATAGNSPTIFRASGAMELDTYNGLIFSGKLIARTRRTFKERFSANLSLYQNSTGVGTVRVKKASDDSEVLHLTVDNKSHTADFKGNYVGLTPVTGTLTDLTFQGWVPVTITKTDSEISLSAGIFTVSFPSDSTSAYYLEVESSGNNTMQVKDLLVYRGVTPPSTTASTTATPTPTTVTLSPVSEGGVFTRTTPWSAAISSYNGYSTSSTIDPAVWGVVAELDTTSGVYQAGQWHNIFSLAPPSGTTITSATYCAYMYYPSGYNTDNEQIALVQSQLFSYPTISDANKTYSVEFATRQSVPVGNTGNKVCFDLNIAGLAYLNSVGSGKASLALTASNTLDKKQPVGRNLFGVNTSKSSTPPTLKLVYGGANAVTTTTTIPVVPVTTTQTVKLSPVTEGGVFTRTNLWSAAISTNTGYSVSSTIDPAVWGVVAELDTTSGVYQAGQWHMGFPLSSLATGATIVSAKACFYMYYPAGYSLDNEQVALVQSQLTTIPTLSDANKTYKVEFATRQSVPVGNTGSQVCFDLNSVGLAYLNANVGGKVYLALTASITLDNKTPIGRNLFGVYTSKSTTPFYLSVTYTGGTVTPPVTPVAPVTSLVASCAVGGVITPINLSVGATGYYGAGVSGGKSTYHFVWNGATGGDTASASRLFGSSGVYAGVSVTVTDSSSPALSATATCPTVTVVGPTPTTVNPVSIMNLVCNPNPVSVGMAAICNVTGSGFSQSIVQFSFFGLGCDVTNGCMLSPGDYLGNATDNSTQVGKMMPNVSGAYALGVRAGTSGSWTLSSQTLRVKGLLFTPIPVPTSSWTWQLTAWSYKWVAAENSNRWDIQPVLTVNGVSYRYDSPYDYVQALQQVRSWGASGPIDLCISYFQDAMINWH